MNCENCKTRAEIKNKVVQLTLIDGRALCAACTEKQTGYPPLFPLLLFPRACSHGMEQHHLCQPCVADEDRLNRAMCKAESQ